LSLPLYAPRREPCLAVGAARASLGRAAGDADSRPREIAELLDAAPNKYRTLIALSIVTGLHQGEALGLLWQDVDITNRVLHVRWQLRQDGKLSEPKTPQAKREVVLSGSLVQMLREQKAASGHSHADDFVLASLAGAPLAHRNIVRRGLEKATEAPGIGKYVEDEKGGAGGAVFAGTTSGTPPPCS